MKAEDFLKTTDAPQENLSATDFLKGGKETTPIGTPEGGGMTEDIPQEEKKPSDTITPANVLHFFTGHFPDLKEESIPEVQRTDKGLQITVPGSGTLPFLQDPVTAGGFGLGVGIKVAKPILGKVAAGAREAVGWMTGGASELPGMAKGAGEGLIKGLEESGKAERMAGLRAKGLDVPIKAEEFLKGGASPSVAKVPLSELGKDKTPIDETLKTETVLQSAIIPGAKEVLEPASQRISRTFKSAADDLRRTFAPLSMGEEAKATGAIMREKLSDMAHRGDVAEAALKQARKDFNSMDTPSKISFMDNIEKGAVQTDAKLQGAADTIRGLLDARRDQIRLLGTGKLETFNENYFPHIWADPKKATDMMRDWFVRTPLEGKKGFLKKRTIPTIEEGLEKGLKLVSDNPVDLTLLKLREMDKYLMAHETLTEMKKTGLAKFFRGGGQQEKDGWIKINDKIANVFVSTEKFGKNIHTETVSDRYKNIKETVSEIVNTVKTGGGATDANLKKVEERALEAFKARGWSEGEAQQILSRIKASPAGETTTTTIERETKATIEHEITRNITTGFIPGKGFIQTGAYYAPENAAAIINGYLEPGLRNKEWFRSYLGLANILNQTQLGLSAFHLGFTSFDAGISKFALGLNQALGGSFIKGAKSVLESPFAPLTTIFKGDKVLKEWYKPGSQGAEIGKVVDNLRLAGGRVRMDKFYQTRVTEKMMDNFRNFQLFRGIARLPFSVIETTMRPIMEQLVPRQKLGVFMDLASWKMEGLAAQGASRNAIRGEMQKIWDSVDNRMGQLVYDNLFWEKTTKDLGMASVRSLGWNLGTFRELGGGAIDLAKQVSKVAKGQRPELTYRMAYTAALPVVVGSIGALTHRLMTGENPQELKDYFFPKTGRMDKDGNPERISFPSYMKDVYHYYDSPGKAIANKLHPALGIIGDMLRNEDYYGTEIRNQDDPFIQRRMSELKFVGKQMAPFSIQGAMKSREVGTGVAGQVLPFVGILPAPKYITRTEIQNEIFDTYSKRKGHPTRSQEEFEKAHIRQEIGEAHRAGDVEKFWAKTNEAVEKGYMKNDMGTLRTLVENQNLPSDIRAFKQLPEQDQKRILTKMNKQEVGKFVWFAHDDIIANVGDLSKAAEDFVDDFRAGKVKKPKYVAGDIVNTKTPQPQPQPAPPPQYPSVGERKMQ